MDDQSRDYGRVGDIALVGLPVPGFSALSLREKLYISYLHNAAKAVRPIAVDQSSPHAMHVGGLVGAMRRVCDLRPILAPEILSRLAAYEQALWVHNGPYDHTRFTKIPFPLSRQELSDAAYAADMTKLARELEGFLLDPAHKPMNMTKTTPQPIADSHNNYYVGVTDDEVAAWSAAGGEDYALNSQVTKVMGQVTELVWRVGDEASSVPVGMYYRQLSEALGALDDAYECATVGEKFVLRALVRFLKTGEKADFDAFNAVWVKTHGPIDFMLGPIEDYLDARGKKGLYQGVIHIIDKEADALYGRLADAALYFENRMPWDVKYRNPNPSPNMRAAELVYGCGDCGPISPRGINLPNDDGVKQEHGSKAVLFTNGICTQHRAIGTVLLSEFAFDEAEVANDRRFSMRAFLLFVAMHEVLGHASGRISTSRPAQETLGGYFSALEEARADLAALWLVLDPKLIELGIMSDADEQRELTRAMYQRYVREFGLVQLRVLPTATKIEEAHMVNRALIVRWTMRHSSAIQTVTREGKTYYVVSDFLAMRRAVGRLLAQIQRIKAEGLIDEARALIDEYGTPLDLELRDEVVRRAAPYNAPSFVAWA